ncbi:MAG: transcriptional regulator [Deltaproteobacteria bacterium CG_4_10_14_3_um_filter_60_8]|nr:MAG: transcriptional regulator [Deltaproteobacteria bacterium CG23_combo_of_CG06-09_8_20_14_all_60_8]PIY21761.1 MAG: transcriptional regulator [Deltaproteobacteria bacterium CG_4_10_14_3_um_filter_60_8]
MALTRHFKKTVVGRIKNDPAFAQGLLDEALTLKLILRDLVNATISFELLAQGLHKPSKSLHRMLSLSGNPTLVNLSAILLAIKQALHVDIRTTIVQESA